MTGADEVEMVRVVRVILLPGIVLPAPLAYEALVAELGSHVEVIAKDLEVYREDSPPAGYSLGTEAAGVLREADAHGWDRFHLVGYSAGASASLACAARTPDRLLSLGLLEPAWAGRWGWSPAHEQLWATYDELARSTPAQFMPAFMRLQVRPEVELPPPRPGPPAPWMERRPAGIRSILRTFQTYRLGADDLTGFDRPVYCALGGLSNPDQFGDIAQRLGTVFWGLHPRGLRRAAPLRPAAPHRAREARGVPSQGLGAR